MRTKPWPGPALNAFNDAAMTEFDKRLIEKAYETSHWDYRHIDILVKYADTEEARKQLSIIRWELYGLVQDTL